MWALYILSKRTNNNIILIISLLEVIFSMGIRQEFAIIGGHMKRQSDLSGWNEGRLQGEQNEDGAVGKHGIKESEDGKLWNVDY